MTAAIEAAPLALLNELDFQALAREKIRTAIRFTLTLVLEKVSAFIGAGPYERTDTRQDQRNGSYPRDLETGAGRITDLRGPRTRKGFRPRDRGIDRRDTESIHRLTGVPYVGGRI